MGNGEPRRPKVMRVSTRCRSVDELVAAFSTLVDDESMVVLTDQQRALGTRQPFVVELADGTFVMRGEAEVVESTPPPRGRLRFKFLALDAGGRDIHQQMLARKRGVAPAKPRAPTEPGLKPLVRIPEPSGRAAEPAPSPAPPSPAQPAIPPAPFARPVPAPSLPRNPVPPLAPVPMIPPQRAPLGTTPPRRAVPVVLPRPSDPAPSIEAAAAKAVPAAPLPAFDELPDLPDEPRTEVDTPVPAGLRGAPAPAAPARAASPSPGTVGGEERTPGSPYILPANPFGEVDPASLEHFVECTLYEETGQFAIGDDGFVNELARPGDGAPVADPPARAPDDDAPEPPTTTMPVSAAPPVVEEAPTRPIVQPAAVTSLVPVPPPAVALPLQAQATPLPGPLPTPPPPVVAMPAPVPTAHVASPMAPGVAPAVAPPASPMLAMPEPGLGPSPRRAPWRWIVAGGLILVGVIVLGMIASEGEDGASAARPSEGVAPDAAAAVAPADAAAAAAADDDDDAAAAADPADADADAAAAADSAGAAAAAAADTAAAADDAAAPDGGACVLTVITEPDDAKVVLDGRALGRSPVKDRTVPCGTAKLELDRVRYEKIERSVTLRAGTPEQVDVSFSRPDHRITVVSRPAGATVRINGRAVGKAPITTTIKAYTKVTIQAELDGYFPAKQARYIKPRDAKLTLTLKRKVRGR